MSKRTESNSYTIIFTIIMVIVVGTLLTWISLKTKPMIGENERVEKKQNILYALGINKKTITGVEGDQADFVPTAEVSKLFDKYIVRQYVIYEGQVKEDKEAYMVNLKKQMDNEKAGKPAYRPIFVAEKEGNTFYIIPMRGTGLWDAIWGYITLDKDKRVEGAFFDHKGETPGLGAEIKAKYFQDRFIGETITDANGKYKGITVLKGNNDPKNDDKDDNEIDALSGATITGDGVTRMIQKDLSFYMPYFDKIK